MSPSRLMVYYTHMTAEYLLFVSIAPDSCRNLLSRMPRPDSAEWAMVSYGACFVHRACGGQKLSCHDLHVWCLWAVAIAMSSTSKLHWPPPHKFLMMSSQSY